MEVQLAVNVINMMVIKLHVLIVLLLEHHVHGQLKNLLVKLTGAEIVGLIQVK